MPYIQRTIFRSEEMSLCDFFLQPEAAFTCLATLGERKVVQLRDMNENVTAYQRKFTANIRKCDEMERICRYVEQEIKSREKIGIFDADDDPPVPNQKEIHDLESHLERLEAELKEVCSNAQTLEHNYIDLVDMRHVLAYVQLHTETQMAELAVDATGDESDSSDTRAIIKSADGTQSELALASLNHISGIIPREKVANFERMLWRVARGNIYLRHAAVVKIQGDAPSAHITAITDEQPAKEVFIAFFQGEQLKTRIKKICEAFHATIHTFPTALSERIRVKAGIETRIADLVAVLGQTDDHRDRLLLQAAHKLRMWQTQIYKVKAIYHEMNKFNVDVSNKCLIGEGWCPADQVDRVRQALQHASEIAGSSVPSFLQIRETKADPPTLFRHNKVSSGFQSIVHSYGVATYREINPALFSTITFPFLFAVMFGDIGHGLIMFLAALYLCIKERQFVKQARENETFGIFFGGRYIILLMGLFSIYTGFIYNDIFSKAIKVMPSSWYVDPNMPVFIDKGKNAESNVLMLEPALKNGTNYTNWKVTTDEPYAFGLDPVWNFATNEIMFSDSMKMKMSVILGVAQMLFGLLLSIGNHVYFKRYTNIFCEFIPMFLFMGCIFIYMDILIIWKWIAITPENSQCAPSILIGVINMVLMTYSDTSCSGQIFIDLKIFQICLVLVAVLSIPWLLLAKPLILWRRAVAKERAAAAGLSLTGSYAPPQLPNPDEEEARLTSHSVHDKGNSVELGEKASKKPDPGSHEVNHEHFELAEEMIHQAIHTIEFCLGLVSHTASYLRLWALSLAHVELSQVLWMYLMKMAFTMGAQGSLIGAIMQVPLFVVWASLTIGILVLMEGLSAFLHALRLHWVEFMSKFYIGSGYAFSPFTFSNYDDDYDDTM